MLYDESLFVPGLCTGYSSIPLTYVLHFLFKNEMNSFAGIMGIYFFLGLLLLVAGIIMDELVVRISYLEMHLLLPMHGMMQGSSKNKSFAASCVHHVLLLSRVTHQSHQHPFKALACQDIH